MNDMPRKPIEKAAESGEWIGLAWAAWCAGERNLAALGKQFNKAPATVKANLIKYSAARAAETQSVDGFNPRPRVGGDRPPPNPVCSRAREQVCANPSS